MIKRVIKKTIKIVLSPAFLINKAVKKTNWYTNVIPDLDNFPTNDWYRKDLTRNFDLAIIGSSSGVYSFDVSVVNVKAFNWCMQPQAMENSYKILKNFFSILKRDGTVVITFSPFSGLYALGKQGKTTDDRFYHLLDGTLIDNIKDVRKRRNYPLFYSPKESLKRLIKDVPKKKFRDFNVCHDANEYENDAKRWMNGWMREFGIADLNAPMSDENRQGSSKRKQTIQDMIDFCKERDLRPVIVIPPIHPSLSRKLTPSFRKNYIYAFVEDFKKQGVPFYDYMDSKDFSEDKYFSNSFFMSEQGAKAFTKHFIQEIL